MSVDFFDLNLSVGKIVIKDVVLISAIEAIILPEDVEAQYFSIIIQEAFEGLVWSTTFKLDFDVVLKFSLIGWSLLEVDHGSSLAEEIFWISFGWTEGVSLVGIESSGEVIASNNSENSMIDIKIEANININPGVVFALIFWVWELMSLEEGSLWDT